ncbi:hypothetical protein [Hyphomicrobium sp. ghe19]|uniref:hypothetical protein n=1 Tax=Hyphomicrobium sp. ghe19 TaxID=2682968 RepID=UPI001367857C|nr:hypothetical protein HYPP_02422 [Hyphomicrobium sp. ghe19]
MNHSHSQQIKPPEDGRRRDAWRAAAKAYREHYNEGADGAYKAAEKAVLALLPDLNQEQASAVAVAAVSYASQYHADWLYALYERKPR